MSREVDPAILSFTHLKQYPRQDEALHLLKRVASMVKPLMRARGWTVRSLSEMHPEQANLLGLNVNRGEQILLRLREPYDRTQFLPFEKVVDTMLHELAHIVHGPHDGKFHALWDQLRDELDGLIMKGYTGEGFLGKGQRLGGAYGVPPHEARRLARIEAERRRQQQQQALSSRGHRLGGSGPAPSPSSVPAIRNAILDSIERRSGADLGCANNNHTDREIQAISQTWTRNGFRTQAEEDAANDAAIAQALWELVQEEQQQQRGLAEPAQPPPVPTSTRPQLIPPIPSSTRPPLPPPPRTRPRSPSPKDYWPCAACTLHNPLRATTCEACETPRPRPSPRVSTTSSSSSTEVVDLTGDSPPRKRTRAAAAALAPAPTRPATWTCGFCSKRMESMWWTCEVCGKMKTSS